MTHPSRERDEAPVNARTGSPATVACRGCQGEIDVVLDLGEHPAGGSFLAPEDQPAALLPLRLGLCAACGLAQLADASPLEDDDPSGPTPLSSATLSVHADRWVAELATLDLLPRGGRILSLASHGGHLADRLAREGRAPVVADPSPERCASWSERGFTAAMARLDGEADALETSGPFDLIVDFYLLAHLQRPRSAMERLARLLAPDGAAVLEFDHLPATVAGGQWDALRHGHQTYLTLGWIEREARRAGLMVLDARPQPVYGGALRVVLRHRGTPTTAVADVLEAEADAAVDRPAGIEPLREVVERARREVPAHLDAARRAGRRVVGYGAPARGVTFLNALSVGPERLPYTVDRSPAKQGRLIPGVSVPIRRPESLLDDRPDEVLVLTWDIVDEVRPALQPLVQAGTRLLVGTPALADVTETTA